MLLPTSLLLLGLSPPHPSVSGGLVIRPQTSETAPTLQISGYAPASHEANTIFKGSKKFGDNLISTKLKKSIKIFQRVLLICIL